MYSHDNGTDAENRPAQPAGSNGSHTIPSQTVRPDDTASDADFDALAGMFLAPAATHTEAPPSANPEAGETTDQTHPARRVPVSALILGHLPVMASAWPAQHARVRAEETGEPVVIARLSRGVLTLESFGAHGPAQPFQTQADALAWAAAHAESVLVRVDEADEAELATAGAVDQLVFLTGADDAAVVACYRKLKNIADTAKGTRPLPASRLTVVGTNASRGRLTHERIARAARAFLDAELLEPVIVDRVAPTRGRLLYRDATTLTMHTLLPALHGAPVEQSAAPAACPEPAAPPQTSQDLPEIPGPASGVGPALASPAHQDPIVSCPVIDAGLPTLSLPTESARPQNARSTPATLPTDPGTNRPGEVLSSFVPGLLPLESTCPVAPDVKLAYDAAGVLHLLTASLTRHPSLSSEAPVRSLLRASAWARSHATLLKRAEPRLATDAADHAEMHLITDRSREALAVLDTPIRVHLAAPASQSSHGLVTVSLDR